MKYLKDINLQNKRVLIRADLNVPQNPDLSISDDNRIKQFLPTLKQALSKGARAIVMSHLGDPPRTSMSQLQGSALEASTDSNGKYDLKFSLAPMAKRLSELLGAEVILAKDCVGQEVEALVNKLEPGRAILLENLRFHPGETANDSEFSALLARLGDVYINDAFATCHRKHASMFGLPKLIKERAAGLLLQKELDYFNRAMQQPKRPLCVVLGGAKVSSKLNALINVSDKADKIIIGGAMANTFLAAQGYQIGKSLVERELFPKVLELLAKLARRECKVYLPVDFLVGPSLSAKGVARAVPAQEMPADSMALDIGPATSLLYREALHDCETIVWNGPMGAFEQEDYAKGTTDMIESLASAHGLTVVGGGDTDAAIHQMQLGHKFDYISTGGGAFLALLEGKTLPAVTALE